MNLTPEAQAVETAYARAHSAIKRSQPAEAAYLLQELAVATIGALERAEKAERVVVALLDGVRDPGILEDARKIREMRRSRSYV